jgi:predicted DNA-binding transcriptional regulator AlpA
MGKVMRDNNETTSIDGPFYNLKTAAEYCGYSEKTFSRILSEYEIPRFGPRNNRFAKSVLTEWMRQPELFQNAGKIIGRAPKMVTV